VEATLLAWASWATTTSLFSPINSGKSDKSKEGRLRRWTLKWFLVIFYGQSLICELILALVSLWLLVNLFKETSKEKTSD